MENTLRLSVSNDEDSSSDPSSRASSASKRRSSTVSTSFLNPHRAMQTASNRLSNDEVRNIKGAVGRVLYPQTQSEVQPVPAAVPALPTEQPSPSAGLPPLSLPRSRSTSRAGDYPPRRGRNPSNAGNTPYAQLENLLGSDNCNKGDLLEFAVQRIERLQKEVNDAGEINAKFQDYLDTLGEKQSKPNPAPPRQSLTSYEYKDVAWMLAGGLLANLAPAELSEQSSLSSLMVNITTRTLSKFGLRTAVVCFVLYVLFRVVQRSKPLLDVARWTLLSLVQTQETPAAPGRQQEKKMSSSSAQNNSSHSSSTASSYQPRAMSHVSAHMLGGGSGPVPVPTTQRHGLKATNMRKIYSAEDFGELDKTQLNTMYGVPGIVGGVRSRATSNPMPNGMFLGRSHPV